MFILTTQLVAEPQYLPAMMERLKLGVPETMSAVAEELHGLVLETFRNETDPWGRSWAEHRPTTLELYAMGGFKVRGRATSPRGGQRLLVASGTLELRAILPGHTATTAFVEVTGPAGIYGAVQNFGNPKNRLPNNEKGRPAPIPARAFLPIRGTQVDMPQEWGDRVMAMFREGVYLEAGIPKP